MVDEQCQPDRRLIGCRPRHAVTTVRFQKDRITWAQFPLFMLARYCKPSLATKYHDPFGIALIVPETFRRGLPKRYYPLKSHTLAGNYRFGDLGSRCVG